MQVYEIDGARLESGPTVFDWLVEIIREHEAEGRVHLELK